MLYRFFDRYQSGHESGQGRNPKP